MREHSDGRRHEAPVRDLFGGDERLDVAEFVARLGEVDPRPAMGARPADLTSDFDAAAAESALAVTRSANETTTRRTRNRVRARRRLLWTGI